MNIEDPLKSQADRVGNLDMNGMSAEQVKNQGLYKKSLQDLLEIEQEIERLKELGKNTVGWEGNAKRKREEINYLAPHAGIPDREVWKEKDPFVFREKNVTGLKRLLKLWHKIMPDYILLTETSAVPYGYAIKEAWKAAFQNEKPPQFYRIESWTERAHVVEFKELVDNDIDTMIRDSDPDSADLPILHKMKEGVAIYLENRIKKGNARILLFDQYTKPMEPRAWHESDNKSQTLLGIGHELRKAYPKTQLYYAGVGLFHNELDFGRSGYPIDKEHPRVTLKRNVVHERKEIKTGNRIDPLDQKSHEEITRGILEKGYFPVGRTIKDPKRRKEAIEYIQKLKEIGKIAGQELHHDIQAENGSGKGVQ